MFRIKVFFVLFMIVTRAFAAPTDELAWDGGPDLEAQCGDTIPGTSVVTPYEILDVTRGSSETDTSSSGFLSGWLTRRAALTVASSVVALVGIGLTAAATRPLHGLYTRNCCDSEIGGWCLDRENGWVETTNSTRCFSCSSEQSMACKYGFPAEEYEPESQDRVEAKQRQLYVGVGAASIAILIIYGLACSV